MSAGLATGVQVGRYRIEGPLAAGGMGVVYRARQVELDKPVALKVIRPEWAADEEFRARFKREARLAASLDHPHIVSPHDFGDEDGVLYVVMPLIEGDDLGAVIERSGPLPLERAADIVAQVAGALDAAHAKGLVHRDVKPANIVLGRRGGREFAYLTDFGVAKAISSETKLTRLGQLPGTPGYVAPEQINGDPVDARTDVYSLGCVLCEAVTGAVPFPRQTPAAMLIAHMTSAPPRVSELAPGVPAAIDAVVDRALAKEPAQRFASAEAFARDLRAAVTGAGEMAPVPAQAAPEAPAEPTRTEAPTEASAEPTRTEAPTEASAEPTRAEAPTDAPAEPPARAEASAKARAPRLPRVPRYPGRWPVALAIAAVGVIAATVSTWLEYRIVRGSFNPYLYGDRLVVIAASTAVSSGLVAAAVARAAGARIVSAVLVAILVAAATSAGLAALDSWDAHARRWFVELSAGAGLATGLAVTVTVHRARAVVAAALASAAGAALGALVVSLDGVLAPQSFGQYAVTNGVPFVIGVVALAFVVAARPRGVPT